MMQMMALSPPRQLLDTEDSHKTWRHNYDGFNGAQFMQRQQSIKQKIGFFAQKYP